MRSFLLYTTLIISGCGGHAQTPSAHEQTGVLTNWKNHRLVQLQLTLTETAIFGQGPCNRFSAQRSTLGKSETIGPIASTRMTCPNIHAETKLFRDLQTINQIRMSDVEMIFSQNGHEIFRFSLTR